jgi:hypothetical protein
MARVKSLATAIVNGSIFTGPHTNKFLASYYASGTNVYTSEIGAKDACLARTDCNGVTQTSEYTLRTGLVLNDSGSGDVSWQLTRLYTGPHTNKFIAKYASGTYAYDSETGAKDACTARTDCNGITRQPSTTRYTLRTGENLQTSSSLEISWKKASGGTYTGPHTNQFLANYATGTNIYTSETLAKNACTARSDCKGITQTSEYTLRTGLVLNDSGSNEVSWQLNKVFNGPHTNKFIANYASGTYAYDSETLAKDACKARTDCNGVTSQLKYTLRTGLDLNDSGSGEVSWQKSTPVNSGLCDQLLQQFHRFDEELSIQGKWQGGSVTGVCRGWGTNKVRSMIVHYSLGRLGVHRMECAHDIACSRVSSLYPSSQCIISPTLF